MPEIKITPLGAGQDVGRSCILLHLGGKNIMLDCGMHMGFKDERKFPDFTAVTKGTGKTLTEYLDCVIISHFHLDHCGALPYMTEHVKYEGPIYMTHPTKAICPMLLEDMVKINEIQKKERVERLNNPKDQLKLRVEESENTDFFTTAQIQACMKRVTAVNLHQTTMVDKDLEIKAYYAGHVLGAAMFRIRVGQQSVVYTGDYNMTPDRHLGAAWIDRCRPDLLITESTYATTIRDSKRCRERDFLKKVHECVDRGGKVLIPVFALGRAQELLILLETYWDRMNIKVPIYFASGMTERANQYYKMFITWTNQKIKRTFVKRNMFDFHHIKPFDKSYLSNPGAMVVFATPGMLHGGLSLHIFKKWAPNENNMIIMPGFCVNGTVGSKVIAGNKRVEIDGQMTEVKMSVQYMSFSAHADAKGIMQLIHYCQPKNVLLVHGEATKMEFLKQKINQEFDIQCYMPANGETSTITTDPDIPVDVALSLMKAEELEYDSLPPDPKRQRLIHGVLIMKDDRMKIVDVDTAAKELNLPRHSLQFTEAIVFREFGAISRTTDKIAEHLKMKLRDNDASVEVLSENEVTIDQGRVRIKIIPVLKSDTEKEVSTTWNLQDDDLGSYIFALLTSLSK